MLLKIFAIVCILTSGWAIAAADFAFFPSLLLGVGVWLGTFLVLILLAAVFVWVLSKFVDPGKPQEQDDPLTRWIVKLYAPAVFTLLRVKIEVRGAEKMPKEGRYVIASNHIFAMDPGIFLWAFPNAQLTFLSKKENLDIPVIGPLMLKIQCQMLDRENDRAALKTILKCISILKEDKASMGVFPEGYTSKDGHLQSFRNGVFKIPQKAGVPIVVCTLRGTNEILHNVIHFNPTRVQLRVLEVIPAEELKGVHTNEIGERVHKLMAADLGE